MVSNAFRHGVVPGVLVLGLAACTVDIAPQTSLPYPPLTEHWPVTVALDYRTGFPDHVAAGEMTGPEAGRIDFRVSAGPASADLVERVARSMFREVVVLRDGDTVQPLTENVVIIIRPRIEEFSAERLQEVDRVSAVYRFETLGRGGTVLDDWRIETWRETHRDVFGETGNVHWQVAFATVIEDIVAEFAMKWGERSGVAQWLATGAIQSWDQTADDRPPGYPAAAVAPRIAVVDTTPDNGMGECVFRRLDAALEDWEVVEYAALRQAFYPWITKTEAGVVGNLERLRDVPGYRRRLEDSGFRYVVQLSGETRQIGSASGFCGAGMGAVGCILGWDKDRTTSLSASVWDFEAVGGAAELSVSKEGRNTGAVILIFPLAYISPTEGPACRELSAVLVAHLTTGE